MGYPYKRFSRKGSTSSSSKKMTARPSLKPTDYILTEMARGFVYYLSLPSDSPLSLESHDDAATTSKIAASLLKLENPEAATSAPVRRSAAFEVGYELARQLGAILRMPSPPMGLSEETFGFKLAKTSAGFTDVASLAVESASDGFFTPGRDASEEEGTLDSLLDDLLGED